MTRMNFPNGKWCSASDAIKSVTSGMKVAIGTFSAEPLPLTQALWARAPQLRNLTVVTGMLMDYAFLKAPGHENIHFRTWFMPCTLLKSYGGKINAEFMPLTSVQAVRYCESADDIDLALVQVSPANAEGMHSFGINNSNTRAMVKAANGRRPPRFRLSMPKRVGITGVRKQVLAPYMPGCSPIWGSASAGHRRVLLRLPSR